LQLHVFTGGLSPNLPFPKVLGTPIYQGVSLDLTPRVGLPAAKLHLKQTTNGFPEHA